MLVETPDSRLNEGFFQSDAAEPHLGRRREILKKHPEIKQLMSLKNPATFGYILLVLAFQIGMVVLVHNQAWWVIFLAIYFVGAFVNHACYTLLHDASHGMIFKGSAWNRFAALLINLATAVPSAISFQTYHLKHHAHQGVHNSDADMPREWEIALFNKGSLGKATWIMLYSILVSSRSFTMKGIRLPMGWTVANYIATLSFDVLILYYFGIPGFLYLLFSTFFGVGLHPAGARWIQEHFIIKENQETYSYYGPLNWVSFNVGYHNEHHDFPTVPWNKLPEIRRIAPEFYNSLHYHTSWTKLLWDFLTDPRVTLLSRMERETRFGLSKK